MGRCYDCAEITGDCTCTPEVVSTTEYIGDKQKAVKVLAAQIGDPNDAKSSPAAARVLSLLLELDPSSAEKILAWDKERHNRKMYKKFRHVIGRDIAKAIMLNHGLSCSSYGCTHVDDASIAADVEHYMPSMVRPTTLETWDGDAYCVNCKEKREMSNGFVRTSDSGRRMAQGTCPVCGTKMNRILGKAF